MNSSACEVAKALRTSLVLAISLVLPASAQTVYRVDDDAPPAGDGLSWATAFDNLDSALAAAGVGSSAHIWVARGRYKPAVRLVSGDARSVSFQIPTTVRVFGGFDGTESSLAQRARVFSQTHLSGDVGIPGDSSDNAYHVVFIQGGHGGSARLDGFKLTDGNANGAAVATQSGGGIQVVDIGGGGQSAILHVANCELTHNAALNGGAVAVANFGRITLTHCALYDNVADKGGAVWARTGGFLSFNSVYARNRAVYGGAIYIAGNNSGQPEVRFVNDVFHDNSAERGAAAFLGSGQQASGEGTWTNCTVALNSATITGGAFTVSSFAPLAGRLFIHNSVVWHNTAPAGAQISGAATVAFSNIEGGVAGVGNIRKNPDFVNELARDLRLQAGSPSNDAGDNAAVPADGLDLDRDGDTLEPLPVDLAGVPRFADDPAAPDTGAGALPVVDQGAYELPAP